ncbi:G-type lectin S-receptor-like serine/threonine-protein kinase RLK1 [Prunus yedoensis var. nudiflora]|uniref:Receptor-like serine/threonine-protein kinase n=1 Tax=Prunus yedoensis var. nudiflora TaxID=2094558 RepID=A0A314ULY0_PRUYE|nr:G-type lectin S-receptor-like serine/threonine-protein kinase RLK1 [Prunus yedoensis var. nudiflora]
MFLLPVSVLAQTNGSIAVGASLTATAEGNSSSSWLSPSGDFAFGFWPLGNNDLFLLSIWYARIPDRTVVWYANGDNEAAVAPKGSTVNLTANSGLVLKSPQGEELWKSETSVGVVANGVMNDTGNFVLQDSNSESLWETFNNHTDTMLPGQTFERSGKLLSRQSETNYSKGSTINLPTQFPNEPYYATHTTNGTVAGSEGKELVFNVSGYLYVLSENGGKTNVAVGDAVSARDNYIRATLNFDGIFAQYYYPKNSTGNVLVFVGTTVSALSKKIRGQPVNAQQGSLYLIQIIRMGDANRISYKAVKKTSLVAQKIYMMLRSETCLKKKLPLSNGRVDMSLNSKAFIKVRKDNSTLQFPPMPNPDDKKTKKKSSNTLIRVESIILAASIFVSFMFCAAACLGFFFVFRKKHVRSVENILDSNLHSFSYQELQEATNGFTEELGRGAFGVVYKGTIQIGSGVQVAVKKLNGVIQDGEKEFKTELRVIGKTHHKNLVCLVGYCDEGQHRLLVYEFLSKGTLASFLFADTKPSWTQRNEIACGVAKGLLYLHEECSTQVIHCDIKPQNILLDDYYTARISDFGLAKLLMINQSKTHTAIRGTKGYVAPEWFSNMPITAKVDVYSFGVVLLEIICCRRSVDVDNSREERAILTDWVYDCYRGGMLDAVLVLDNEVQALDDRMKPEKLVMIAIWCIQDDPSLRPTMRKVVQMLEGVVEVHLPPCPSSHTTRTG